ncbi:hypothetical protein [Neorhizobium sp. DT-125]|uniref:hypothetical protein n=1 Tax=Neorhizobium sp. DT-125 TaxID=3396163 RepID=UPI003F1CFF4B
MIGIALLVLWLLMLEMGMLRLGLPPSGPEIVRSVFYLAATLRYAAVWLALAMAFSTLIRPPAASALVSPVDLYNPMTLLSNFETQQAVSRLSPQMVYGEISALLLDRKRDPSGGYSWIS